MSNSQVSTQVEALLQNAKQLAELGKAAEAANALEEASALDRNNAGVRKAWEELKSPDDELATLCRSLSIISSDSDEAQHVLSKTLLASRGTYAFDDATEALSALLDADRSDNVDNRDQVVGSLLAQPTGQTALSRLMTSSPTETFGSIFHLGSESFDGLTKTCITPAVWAREPDRIRCIQNTFTLLLAALIEPDGAANAEKGMKAIANLMALNASDLVDSIDDGNLAIILGFLNIGNGVRLRSQATLVTAKFLEASKSRGQSMLKTYVTDRIAKHTNDDIVDGFSAAGAMFPITPDTASALFLTPGFTDDLARVVQKSSSSRLRHSALELLSAACINKDCRAAIRDSCKTWIEDVIEKRPSETDTAMAALVLSKISRENGEVENLTQLYKSIITNSGEAEVQTAIEGLAYSSTQPKVKEDLAKDTILLRRIVTVMDKPPHNGPLIFGGLTILSNLTTYPPEVSAEEKRMAQLKAYANQSKVAEPSPLDNPSHVAARAKKTLDAGVMQLLVRVAKAASPTLLNLVASIALNIAKERKHCGTMIQQGILDVLIPMAAYDGKDATLLHARICAAQALARTIIPIDPMLTFSNYQNTSKAYSISHAVKGLKTLLDNKESQDPRPAFEALQALTNLASIGEEVSTLITKSSFASIESYLSSNLSAQQQASVECLANLTVFEACSQMFVADAEPRFPALYDGTTDAVHLEESRFLHLRALTEDDVRGTRVAATAAIFNITQQKAGARMLMKAPSGLERLVPYINATNPPESEKADADLRARVVGIIVNMLQKGGKEAVVRLKKAGALEKLREAKMADQTGSVSGFAEEAIALLDKE